MLHFPGFEPLTAAQHHRRYRQAAVLSSKAWGLNLAVDDLEEAGPVFDVEAAVGGATVASRLHILDHFEMVRSLGERPSWRRVASGFKSAATITLRGGLHGYFRSAWRFGLFFLFPFVLIAACVALSVSAIVLSILSGQMRFLGITAAVVAGLLYIGPSLLARLHVTLLLSNWKFALMLARPLDAACEDLLARLAASARSALARDVDEVVITAHSMGANVAVHVIGLLLENEPQLFAGKRVVFVTMGGAVLQCALIGGATSLREKVGRIARQPNLDWVDVQCLTDPVSFYRSRVVADAGHPDAPQARIVFMRIKKMVSASRYRKMRGNFLRVHRQYVLGSDARHVFDFVYLTAGPEPASAAGLWARPAVASGALPTGEALPSKRS